MTLDRVVLDDVTAFADAFGVRLHDWQRDAFGAVCRREAARFKYRLGGVSVPRGNGKSYGAAVVGLWRLLCGPPPQDVLGCALDVDGAKVVLAHARAIVRASDVLSEAVTITATGLEVPATGSRWTIASREHQASRGRHPTVVLYDEVGWARDDELFSSLLAGQASVADPLCLVVSTVGRRQSGPLWQVKQLAEGGDESVAWWYSSENLSPAVSSDFLERQRRILLPGAFAREHQNQWIDAADSFTSAAEVDAAMSHGWLQQHVGDAGERYAMFVDLGLVHDATVLCIGHEQDGMIYIDVLHTYQGSRAQPVQLQAVEDAIRDLARRFSMATIRIESWQGAASVQKLERLGLPVEITTPTAKSNAEEWPVLGQRLASRTLVLPNHGRLREELLNLVVTIGATGARVSDPGSVHQDHAVAVRGVVAALHARSQARGELRVTPMRLRRRLEGGGFDVPLDRATMPR